MPEPEVLELHERAEPYARLTLTGDAARVLIEAEIGAGGEWDEEAFQLWVMEACERARQVRQAVAALRGAGLEASVSGAIERRGAGGWQPYRNGAEAVVELPPEPEGEPAAAPEEEEEPAQPLEADHAVTVRQPATGDEKKRLWRQGVADRIVELLRERPHSTPEIVRAIRAEFDVSEKLVWNRLGRLESTHIVESRKEQGHRGGRPMNVYALKRKQLAA